MKVTTIEQMKSVWRKAGQNGGRTRARRLSARKRREIARLGGLAAKAKRERNRGTDTGTDD